MENITKFGLISNGQLGEMSSPLFETKYDI